MAFKDARKIASQHPDQALSSGSLNVSSFMSSRAFEVRELEAAMLRSRNSASKRAFQLVPRSMRRRAASHNVKRVPKRLRRRALHEMADGPTVTSRKPKRFKSDPETDRNIDDAIATDIVGNSVDFAQGIEITDKIRDLTTINRKASPTNLLSKKYYRRQAKKIWLPTHLWQSKRSHMTNVYGYSIVRTPTEKCYRTTHRILNRSSSAASAMAWDTSYFCNFILEGPLKAVEQAVETIAGKRANSPMYKIGGRVYEDSNESGPIFVLWNTRESVLFRVHPAIYEDMIQTLTDIVSKDSSMTFQDCKFSIGSIDIVGAKSLAALISVLEPLSALSPKWNELAACTNPESFPSQLAIKLNSIRDPRLSFPRVKPKFKRYQSGSSNSETIDWDSLSSKESNLFQVEKREQSLQNYLTLQEIDKLRLVPGKPLPRKPNDSRFPVIVVKRSTTVNYANIDFTVLIPWHWVMPVWYSLMHIDNVHAGGEEQLHQLCQERQILYFPNDFIHTPSYEEYSTAVREELFKKWSNLPKGKRVEFTKEVGDPFSCDWACLKNIHHNQKLVPVRIMSSNKRHQLLERARIIKNSDEKELVVGFITSGLFNLALGVCTAVGYIAEAYLQQALLVRNCGQTHSFGVTIECIDT